MVRMASKTTNVNTYNTPTTEPINIQSANIASIGGGGIQQRKPLQRLAYQPYLPMHKAK